MNRYALGAALAGAFVFAGCEAMNHGAGHDHSQMHGEVWGDVSELVAVVHPTEGNDVSGVVRLADAGDGATTISAEITGLEPGSTHGLHVHQFGDCTASDGTSAGGHYNPEGLEHGLPEETDERHAGDLGNIQADADGNASMELTVENLTLTGPNNPAIGRGVIVHAGEDDGSQPTGAAGSRLGCGVLGVAQD